MSKTLSSNSIYKGGSPRVQHEVLKSKPKIYGQSDINSYIDKIKKHYLAHNITFQDLIYMDNYFTTLKSNNDYAGNKNNSSLIKHFILTIETLYADGKIDKNYIQLVINEISKIIHDVTPPKIETKLIKTENTTNTINNYDGSIVNIRNKKPTNLPEKNLVTSIDLNSIVNVIKKYYYNNIITKNQIEKLINSFKVLNGDTIELSILPNFLKKINMLVENAITEGRMSQSNLLLLITDVQTIVDSDKPIFEKKQKIVKSKLSTISPYYNK